MACDDAFPQMTHGRGLYHLAALFATTTPSTLHSGPAPGYYDLALVAIRDAENIAERRFELRVDNARRFAADEPLRNVVDKAAWY